MLIERGYVYRGVEQKCDDYIYREGKCSRFLSFQMSLFTFIIDCYIQFKKFTNGKMCVTQKLGLFQIKLG